MALYIVSLLALNSHDLVIKDAILSTGWQLRSKAKKIRMHQG